MKTPGNDYYPEEWDSQEYLVKDETIALNSERLGKATPYEISAQIAEFTRQFSETVINDNSAEDLSKYNTEEWKDQYLDGKTIFVPENRWTHEVQRGPVHISDNLYAIYLDADIFIREHPKLFLDEKGEGYFGKHFEFTSRTLYKYVKETENNIVPDSYENILDSEYCLSVYSWVLRWTTYKPSKLTFYTTPEIENSIGCKTEKFVVDCSEETKNIEIPVIFKSTLKEDKIFLRHDSLIMYMEVEEYE